MDFLAIAGLAAAAALVFLWVQGKKVPGRVILNSPSTVWPIGIVVFASLVALAVAAFTYAAGLEPQVVIVLTVIAWFFAGADRTGEDRYPGCSRSAIGRRTSAVAELDDRGLGPVVVEVDRLNRVGHDAIRWPGVEKRRLFHVAAATDVSKLVLLDDRDGV